MFCVIRYFYNHVKFPGVIIVLHLCGRMSLLLGDTHCYNLLAMVGGDIHKKHTNLSQI